MNCPAACCLIFCRVTAAALLTGVRSHAPLLQTLAQNIQQGLGHTNHEHPLQKGDVPHTVEANGDDQSQNNNVSPEVKGAALDTRCPAAAD